jgi:transposase
VAGRRLRRHHSNEFKADAVAAASQPGVSMASVALALGVNANLLRRWVRDAEVPSHRPQTSAVAATGAFVPLRVPDATGSTGEIRIENKRGAVAITVAWPMGAATECAAWMRELLR